MQEEKPRILRPWEQLKENNDVAEKTRIFKEQLEIVKKLSPVLEKKGLSKNDAYNKAWELVRSGAYVFEDLEDEPEVEEKKEPSYMPPKKSNKVMIELIIECNRKAIELARLNKGNKNYENLKKYLKNLVSKISHSEPVKNEPIKIETKKEIKKEEPKKIKTKNEIPLSNSHDDAKKIFKITMNKYNEMIKILLSMKPHHYLTEKMIKNAIKFVYDYRRSMKFSRDNLFTNSDELNSYDGPYKDKDLNTIISKKYSEIKTNIDVDNKNKGLKLIELSKEIYELNKNQKNLAYSNIHENANIINLKNYFQTFYKKIF